MDYKKLLLSYMTHVGFMEGTDFINPNIPPPPFITQEEWEELAKLSEESQNIVSKK